MISKQRQEISDKLVAIGKKYADTDMDTVKKEVICDLSDSDLYTYTRALLRSTKKESLKHLLQGAVIYELLLRGGQGFGLGSATPTHLIYKALREVDAREAIKMVYWARNFGLSNEYFPCGGASDLCFYKDVVSFSTDEVAIERAQNHLRNQSTSAGPGSYDEYFAAERRRKHHARLKLNDKRDKENGIKQALRKKLDSLSDSKKLHIMANDTEHSPQFYPKNMIHQIHKRDVWKLTNKETRQLREMFSIKIDAHSPWASVKDKLVSYNIGLTLD